MTVSSHVLDTVRGLPAAGVTITALNADNEEIYNGSTDHDGRLKFPANLFQKPGQYSLSFATKDYFDSLQQPTFYPKVVIQFLISDPSQHYHIPLLLSPFGYSTYRGS